ncbi:exostosin 3 [Trichuris trichiura]|uniref:Exostosin 3 n=1 Tax=Trichuris trichiura TaxID=36087 RepID=A0A077YYI2_TRITR|nr:exostosin 3 [Trichuris trichiura]
MLFSLYLYSPFLCQCSECRKFCALELPGADLSAVKHSDRARRCDPATLEELEKRNLQDLVRLKGSILNELLSLEEKRNALLVELGLLRNHANNLQANVHTIVRSLNTLKTAIANAQDAYRDAVSANYPEVYLPLTFPKPFEIGDQIEVSSLAKMPCRFDTCWNYAPCPITAPFSVIVPTAVVGEPTMVGAKVVQSLQLNFLTEIAHPACVNISVASSFSALTSLRLKVENVSVNNFCFFVGDDVQKMISSDIDELILGSSWFSSAWSSTWHMVMPDLQYSVEYGGCSTDQLPLLTPARRSYLLSVFNLQRFNEKTTYFPMEQVAEVLKSMLSSRTSDSFYFASNCSLSVARKIDSQLPCINQLNDVVNVLKNSTFTLVYELDFRLASTPNTQNHIVEAVKFGAIPVLLGEHLRLPFDEVLDWRRASIRIPVARITELHFLLRSLSDGEILELRRNGRSFWQQYMCNTDRIVVTALNVLRHRLGIQPSPIDDVIVPQMYNASAPMPVSDMPPVVNTLDSSEFLGPVETPHKSAVFSRNYSQVSLHSYDWWNVYVAPFRLYPNDPFAEALPSEAKFRGSHFGFRPIDGGRGGSGKEFSKALGGNFPKEQFTVVMLTYNREQVLIQALLRLAELPYLNKVIVVWNGESDPSIDLVWPKLTAPIVLRPGKNSLNNRFLPFAEIETEAILSIDDDVQLRHDEIIFAFRAWRESRRRIVGFPGRFHSWTNHTWYYNSSHSCELSMVLTGAAFIHKHYFYLYTYWMPQAIRDIVDEVMNCEDVAMNFLVAHVTRLPPLKVTSRWTFACPMCSNTLSNSESHYWKRHRCLSVLMDIYGYNPLLNTQLRADSVLFKTKIPAQHQKCFKFV